MVNKGDGIVNLQSNELGAKAGNERFHIGGQDDHSVKDPSETGRGGAGSWQVYRCDGEEGEPRKCTGDNPLHKEGTYIFQSVKGGKNLRIKDDGSVDCGGGNGKWARFRVHLGGSGGGSGGSSSGTRKVKIQSRKHDGYLRITPDGEVNGEGTGGTQTVFIVHNHGGGEVSLQSERLAREKDAERYHIGGTADSEVKDPARTGRGEAGTWQVYRCDGDSDEPHKCTGSDPLHKEGIYIFKSKAGGKHLRIRPDKSVDVEGGTGSQARLNVTHA